jgi:hypothetical protein
MRRPAMKKSLNATSSFSIGSGTDSMTDSRETFQKIACRILERCDMSSCDCRPPEVIAHTGKSSLPSNFHMTTTVGGVPAVARISRQILFNRCNILLRSNLRRGEDLIISNRRIRLFSRRPSTPHRGSTRIFRSHWSKPG